ncbi:MAG: GSCFA domain-containing protein [Paracoccaceae bacterium]
MTDPKSEAQTAPAHPYEDLPETAYWRPAVADAGPHRVTGLWTPKFRIKPSDKVVTAGSCFAQHIGRALTAHDYNWTDFEPAPPFFPDDEKPRYGYGIFSFRTGNIYTPSMLHQWLRLSHGEGPDASEFWEKEGRIYDPLRPAIEPDGFTDLAEFTAAREATYRAIRNAAEHCDVFVFTLGLTEHWTNADTELEYAMCPGTIAGTFDADRHVFGNANARKVYRDTRLAAKALRAINPGIRVLLTVSPVPLTATASGKHVLTATSYSKSVLRSAAGQLSDDFNWIDYFPSYEIITHPVFRGMFFAPNMRNVEPAGVETVMSHFFAEQNRAFGKPKRKKRNATLDPAPPAKSEVQCEEVMLDAFAR